MEHVEVWKDVIGYEWAYEVSNLGNIRSKDRHLEDGRFFHGRSLKPWDHDGYGVITFPGNNKVGIHRVVCQAFNGNPPEGKPFALHRNGKPMDNRADNLYWGDYVDNVADALTHGTHVRVNALKTHCKQGHPFDEENTYTPPNTTYRACRICLRSASRRYNLKKKQTRLDK